MPVQMPAGGGSQDSGTAERRSGVTQRLATAALGPIDEAELHRALFESTPVVTLLIDPRSGLIVDANPAAAAFYGYPAEVLKAMTFADLSVHPPPHAFSLLEGPDEMKRTYFRLLHRLASGEMREVDVFNGPVKIRDRVFLHSIVHDVSRRSRAEQALRESDERYRIYVQASPIAIFVHDSGGRVVEVNEAASDLTGYMVPELLGMQVGDLFTFEPESATPRPVDQTGGRGPISAEARVARKDGRAAVAAARVARIRHGPFISFLEDITERRAAEEALRESEERYRNLVALLRVGVGVHVGRRLLFVNDALVKLLGYRSQEEIVGRDVLDFLPPERGETARERIASAMSEKKSADSREHELVQADGSRILVEVTGSPITFGGADAVLAIFRDITERRKMEEALVAREQRFHHEAMHDALTGLANRSNFLGRLRRAIETHEAKGRTAALLFVDLDFFKHVNDTFGHAAGDLLLTEVAARLKSTLRSVDVVARLGGDEFAVLIHDLASPAFVTLVADRIQQTMAPPFSAGAREFFVTASIGIAFVGAGSREPADVLRDADRALYRAKETGRDRYEVFDVTAPTGHHRP